MKGKIRTILIDIDPQDLGYTMAHEHILDEPAVGGYNDPDHQLTDYDKALEMMQKYKAMGGQGVAEASPKHWGRNTLGMADIAQKTGVNIICCTGYLCESQVNMDVWVNDKTIQDLQDEMLEEIEVGMDGTEHKAGWIKVGSSYNYISEREERIMRAAARASLISGAPVHSHTSTGTMGLEQIAILESEGLDMQHFCVAHVSRNPDYYYHKKMLEHGVYLLYDGPGKPKYYTDEKLIEVIRKLVDDGYEDKIMLSNDMGKKTHHKVYGYGPGYEYIHDVFLPRLIDEGFDEKVVHKFMYENPAKFYTMYK